MANNTLVARQTPLVVVHDAARSRWLSFTNPRELVVARRLEEVLPGLARVEAAVATQGLYAAGFVSYEAAPAFDPALSVKADSAFPLLWFGLYPELEEIALPHPATKPAGELVWQSSIAPEEYRSRLLAIKELIGAGDTYQVNFTYRLHALLNTDPWELFLRLVAAQESAYGAFVDTSDWAICSASPELFFGLEADLLESRPMKGTAARGLWFEQDQQQAAELRASEKDRAENTMIVDMVRNDLGRICEPGSVKVPSLFTVEKYPTVWQMTSSVCGRSSAGLDRIFQGLFPPASITGAPKARTMQIIVGLESSPRRIYTGSIGFAAPGRRAQFNVAIRTVLVNKTQGSAEYGVGSGIVWDSDPEHEAQECRVKARVLRPPLPGFELLETILWKPELGYFLLEHHLKRLGQSADYFGFACNLAQVLDELRATALHLPPAPHRVRLLVAKNGSVAVEAQLLEWAFGKPPSVTLAHSAVDSSDPFLYHKTTNRRIYQEALAACPGFADVLLYNQKGEATESTIANLVVDIGGALHTPPVHSGLLAGVYRAWLLEQGRVGERVVTVDELLQSPRVFLANSVRGLYRVKLVIPKEGEAY